MSISKDAAAAAAKTKAGMHKRFWGIREAKTAAEPLSRLMLSKIRTEESPRAIPL